MSPYVDLALIRLDSEMTTIARRACLVADALGLRPAGVGETKDLVRVRAFLFCTATTCFS